MGLFATNLFQIADCVSVPTFCHFVDHLRLLLENSPFKNLWRINCLSWNFVQCGRIHFSLPKAMNKLISTKNRVFISLVGPSETGKSQLIYNWLKIGTLQPKFDKIYFFYQHSQPLYDVIQKEIENLEFVRGVNFEFIDSLKNNGTKYLLIFDDSCEEICNSNAFVDIATAGRHRGLSTIYIKHSLFHQSKLGRDVELQNTHNVLSKSPRDVMQVTTLSTQLGLGSQLVDWYRDATSVPFGHLLIDLSPRTDDRLRYCTNTGSIPSKFYIPDRLNILDDEHTKSLYSPCVPIIFPQMQKSFPSVLPERVYPVSLRMHNKSAQRKPAKHKKTSRGKISKRGSTIVSKTNNLEAKKTFWRPKEAYSSLKLLLLPSLTICLDREQFVLVPASVYNKSLITPSATKQDLPKYQPLPNPMYQIDSLKKEINKKLFSKADSLVDKFLSCPRIKQSNSNFTFGWCGNWNFPVGLCSTTPS